MGREKVPVLYKPIYDTIQNSDLPQVLDTKWALHGTVVFTEHIEGEEIKFGSLQAEQGPLARILTYAAGFEYSKEMGVFNHAFKMEILNKSMGEAYNALLNDIHFKPIISSTYPAGNKTAFAGVTGDPRWLAVWKTLVQAKKDAGIKKRQGDVLLANSADRMDIEMALKGLGQIEGTTYPAVGGIDTVIYYDGYSVQVGKKNYEYAGVPVGKAYLIRPKKGLKELLKQDLRIESAKGDLTRLIEKQIVGYAMRGVYAAVQENVQEISLV